MPSHKAEQVIETGVCVAYLLDKLVGCSRTFHTNHKVYL